MKHTAVILVLALLFAAPWWFWGRKPYVTIDQLLDPILIYNTPKWNGWDRRGLKWSSDIPHRIRTDYPDATGWWYVVHRTVPVSELPEIDHDNLEDTLSKWDQYHTWVPLGYPLPDDPPETHE